MLAVPSRSTTTDGARDAAASISSMTLSSVTSARTSKLSGLPERFAQAETGWFGSASMRTTYAPFWASWDASTTALVDLPHPPFGEARAMTGMPVTPAVIAGYLPAIGKRLVSQKLSGSQQEANGMLPDIW